MTDNTQMSFGESFQLIVDSYGPLNTLRSIGRRVKLDKSYNLDAWERKQLADDIRTMRKIRTAIKAQHDRTFYPETCGV